MLNKRGQPIYVEQVIYILIYMIMNVIYLATKVIMLLCFFFFFFCIESYQSPIE